ncbi:hypothetical protein C8F04DRAFT_1232350 [Mycena alexandri]|uniref:Uncharacterized protein n=1 Tax=Mycena alexandri TaxID=1745969 RepID=A0AAD6X7R6_9AGAR|nr:hypothetical protein C8F04DRAFT_1232350 [Mycena alexandri]
MIHHVNYVSLFHWGSRLISSSFVFASIDFYNQSLDELRQLAALLPRKSLFLWLGLKQTWSRPLNNQLGDAALAGGEQKEAAQGEHRDDTVEGEDVVEQGRTWWSKGRTCCIKPEDTRRTDVWQGTNYGGNLFTAREVWSCKEEKTSKARRRHIQISLALISLSHTQRVESWSGIDTMEETSMEWIGVEFDARDLILNLKIVLPGVDNNLKICQVELLLHTTPQIYTTKQWLGVARTPDSKRGFKVLSMTRILATLGSWPLVKYRFLGNPPIKLLNSRYGKTLGGLWFQRLCLSILIENHPFDAGKKIKCRVLNSTP